MRIGQGYDLHALIEGDGLIIGGVKIPHTKKFLAHSDGDVLVHSIIDSILGAMGESDIGTFFPDNDPKYRQANSIILLNEIISLMKKNGYKISNIDTTIIAQEPKLMPYINKIKLKLCATLEIANTQIAVKAKTNEKMDAIGEGRAIAAYSTVLLQSINPNV